MDLKNYLILFLLISIIIKFNKTRKEKFNTSEQKAEQVFQKDEQLYNAFIGINNDNVELRGDNLDIKGNINFNSNKTTFKGANGTSPTHFPYLDSDGTSMYNYISGPTIFREGSVQFENQITVNSKLTTEHLITKTGEITQSLNVGGDLVIDGKLNSNELEINNLVAKNNIVSKSGNINGQFNVGGIINGSELRVNNLVSRNGNITNSLDVNNLNVAGEINALGGIKPTWSNTWKYNNSNKISAMVSKNSIPDGTYLVIGIGSKNFTGMTVFTKKGTNITSSINNNLVVEGNNDRRYQGGAIFVRFNHRLSMNITVMFIKISNINI